MPKMHLQSGCVPDPFAALPLQRSHRPLPVFTGAYFYGEGGQGRSWEGRGRERKGGGERGRLGKGRRGQRERGEYRRKGRAKVIPIQAILFSPLQALATGEVCVMVYKFLFLFFIMAPCTSSY